MLIKRNHISLHCNDKAQTRTNQSCVLHPATGLVAVTRQIDVITALSVQGGKPMWPRRLDLAC